MRVMPLDQAMLTGQVDVIERLGTETVVNLRVGSQKNLMSLSEDRAFAMDADVGRAFPAEKSPSLRHLTGSLAQGASTEVGPPLRGQVRKPVIWADRRKPALSDPVRSIAAAVKSRR